MFRKSTHPTAWRSLVVAALLSGIVTASNSAPQKVEEKAARAQKDTIELQVATVLDAPGTTLAFTISNNTDKDFRTSTFVGTWNRIVVTKPDGKEVEIFDKVMEVEPNIIKASQSKTNTVQMSELLSLPYFEGKFSAPGIYRVHWKLRDITRDSKFIQSNEVLLLRNPPPELKGK